MDDAKGEIKKLRATIHALETKLGQLEDMFTTEQRRHLYSKESRLQWLCNDTLTDALVIHMAGPKAYEILRNRGWPLPCPRTLTRMTSQYIMKVGLQQQVLDWFKANPKTGINRYCIAMFDEMSVGKDTEFDTSNSEVVSPANYAQVVVVKGLFDDYKQVISIDFDKKMTKTELLIILDALEGVGLRPCATVNDLGGGNRGLWTELDVTPEKSYFQTSSGNKVFVFADTPHLIKLARNHLLDGGYTLPEGHANIEPLQQLVKLQRRSPLQYCPKVTASSLRVKGQGRMKVKTATKTLSNQASAALKMAKRDPENEMPDNTEITAYVLKMFNDW